MGETHSPGLVAVGAVLALALTGCSLFGDEGADPEPAAEAFARGLSSGNLTGVGYVDRRARQVQRLWDDTVVGMGDAEVDVRLVDVTQQEDSTDATATLGYVWELGEKDWSYQTTARLSRASGQWLVDFEPAVVEPSLKDGERLDLTEIEPERGDILGAGGTRLVTDRPVARFGIDKTRVGPGNQASSARRLATLLDVDADDLAARVEAAGDAAFVEALVLRTADVTPAIANGYESIPGALLVRDEIPLGPTREFARPILGTVGAVTAEIIEESDEEYAVGDQVGLSGLQQRYQELLAGRPGVVVTAEGGASDADRELFRARPIDGEPLRTTLDQELQLLAEDVLAEVGPASALVAIRPSDSHVLAAASGPGSNGYSTATLGRYAPGSTFKVVTSLALLRAGLTPDSPVPCTETIEVNGKSFKNYDDYPAGGTGRIDLRTAVANSCNTAFISQRRKASQAALAEAAATLGLGVDRDLGYPAYLGSVPSTASETGHAASMIGQGKVLASPLAMASVAASVATGSTVTPRLVPRDPAPEEAASPTPLTATEADQLRELMGAVVTEGSATFLAQMPGGPVLAKTGTAEFGTEVPLRTHAWMIAVHGDLAVAAFVEVGESGSQTAGPLLEEFLRATG